MSGAIFEYTDDDLSRLRVSVGDIIMRLEKYSDHETISRENVTLMINALLRNNNQGMALCGGISEAQALANLIYLTSGECILCGGNANKWICFYNYKMKISNLINGAKQILIYLCSMKQCCMCVDLNRIINGVMLTDKNLEAQIDGIRVTYSLMDYFRRFDTNSRH